MIVDSFLPKIAIKKQLKIKLVSPIILQCSKVIKELYNIGLNSQAEILIFYRLKYPGLVLQLVNYVVAVVLGCCCRNFLAAGTYQSLVGLLMSHCSQTVS